MTRECGDCTLCCKLLGVLSIKKPQGKWCVHCTPGRGCGTHDDLPTECAEFKCLWLQSTPDEIPEEWRPDLLRMILTISKDGQVVTAWVDQGFERVLERDDVRRTFTNLVRKQGLRVVHMSNGRPRELVDT